MDYESKDLELLNSNSKLSEQEISDLICNYEIERIKGDNSRWSRNIVSIIKLKDKYFKVCWEEGLTEYQENSYIYQPYEVKLQEKEVKIIQRNWVEISK